MSKLSDLDASTLQPTWLLNHAQQLLTKISDTERPRTVHPRRAVSASYYALFHYVTTQAAYTAVPRSWEQMSRGFTHTGIAKIAGWLKGDSSPTSVSGTVRLARSPEMIEFARIFVILQKEREDADYSHEVVIDRQTGQQMIDNSRAAIDGLNQLDYDDESWRAFVALMLMHYQPRSYHLPAKNSAGSSTT